MGEPVNCIVHPLVLLSAVDHYNRVAKDTVKRVVGVLLGSRRKGELDITNCFAVPFDEDRRDADVWYLDQNYLEEMAAMFRKVNVGEEILGFYSSGPKIRPADLSIDEMFRKYLDHPILVVIDVTGGSGDSIPTQCYCSTEEVKEGKEALRVFKHVSSEVRAYEAEEVGVEHLLRDVGSSEAGTLWERLLAKAGALKALVKRLRGISDYLGAVLEGKAPVKGEVVLMIQEMMHLLPNLNVDRLVTAIKGHTNDASMAMYVSALVRCIDSLHSLLQNKMDKQLKLEKEEVLASKKKADERQKKKGEEEEKEEAKKA